MKTIFERLDAIIPEIEKKSFRENRGLGNEAGYYVFDYEPKHELVVRDYIKFIKDTINNGNYDFKIKEFDLYEIMLEILNSKGYLNKNIEMEKVKGSDRVFEATRKTLRLTGQSDLIIQYIKDNITKDDIVFLTGVGKVWPIIRSHTILNNLHSAIDEIPVVMFFPGTYDGLELVLLDEIKDDNYYRAFKLVER